MNEPLFVETGNCPICEKNLFTRFSTTFSDYGSSIYCTNGCFRTYKETICTTYTIFKETPVAIFANGLIFSNQDQIDHVLSLIEYYKKDYRYLMEILTKDSF